MNGNRGVGMFTPGSANYPKQKQKYKICEYIKIGTDTWCPSVGELMMGVLDKKKSSYYGFN